jgi:hypothetical protein
MRVLCLVSFVFMACSSTKDSFVQPGKPQNSFDRNSSFKIPRDEGYSEWGNRRPDPLQNTYVGEGVNPNGRETQFPFGRTGWGTRQYEHSF